MGLFSKKELCPICGSEVKGLFLVKIANKQSLCKDCSKRISMCKAQLKDASPEYIREHLSYRQKNAEKYASLHWDVEYTDIPETKVGVDFEKKQLYLVHEKMHDEDNPVVFSFDQITGYELYRLTKKVDSADEPGSTPLESGLTVLAGIGRALNGKNDTATDYFKLKIKTTEPYWPELDLKITFTPSRLHGFGGFGGEMTAVCQILKKLVRKEPLTVEDYEIFPE